MGELKAEQPDPVSNADRAANLLAEYVVDQGDLPAEAVNAAAAVAQVFALLAVADEIRVAHRTLAAWMQALAERPGPPGS